MKIPINYYFPSTIYNIWKVLSIFAEISCQRYNVSTMESVMRILCRLGYAAMRLFVGRQINHKLPEAGGWTKRNLHLYLHNQTKAPSPHEIRFSQGGLITCGWNSPGADFSCLTADSCMWAYNAYWWTISLSQKTKVHFGLARTDDKPKERLSLLRLSRGAKEEDEVKSHF